MKKTKKLLANLTLAVLRENIGLLIIFFLPRLYGVDHVRGVLVSWSGVLCGRNVKIKRGISFGPPGSFRNVSIGDNSFLNENVRFGSAGRIKIGMNCSIGPGASFETVNHPYDSDAKKRISVIHDVEVGDNVWIGSNAVILPDVSIGSNSIIAAGAVVTESIAPHSLVGGVPARLIRFVNEG